MVLLLLLLGLLGCVQAAQGARRALWDGFGRISLRILAGLESDLVPGH